MNQAAATSSLFSVVRAREAGLGGKQGSNDASAMWLDAIFNVSSWRIAEVEASDRECLLSGHSGLGRVSAGGSWLKLLAAKPRESLLCRVAGRDVARLAGALFAADLAEPARSRGFGEARFSMDDYGRKLGNPTGKRLDIARELLFVRNRNML
jgi:hypothetical protein